MGKTVTFKKSMFFTVELCQTNSCTLKICMSRLFRGKISLNMKRSERETSVVFWEQNCLI